MITSILHRSTSRWLPAATQAAWASSGSRAFSSTDAADTAAACLPLIPTPVDPETAGPILSAAMGAIDSMHEVTGLPWWASIVSVALGVRVAMLPVSLKGIKASGGALALLRQAREEASGERTRSEGEGDAPTEGAKEDWGAITRRFHQLRRQNGVPSPLWVVGSPLLQLPIFITAMGSIRAMSLSGWPGFSTGGAAWFPDLTQPAVDFAAMTAPMGPIGIVLPLAIALSMYANIDAAFSLPARASGSHPNPMMAYVMEKIRLLLEWAVVPLFVVSLQLPQGALCYWATSSAFALAQNHALKVPLVRAAAGLPTGQLRPLPSSSTSTSASTSESKQRFSKNVPPAAQQMAAEAEDVDRALAPLFAQAAEQQARGNGIAAEKVLKRILDQSPMHPRALFALGQVQSGLREWAAAAESYLEATRCEGDPMQRCRAWFGVGVALHMKGDEEGAVEAFSRAAGPEASEQLRVRAWVAAAQLELKLGRREAAIGLLRMAAKVEPKVEEVYLRPLLAGEGPGSER